MKSPAVTEDFIRELKEQYPQVNLAKLFCDSLSQLSQVSSDRKLRDECAADLRRRIAWRVDVAEEKLESIDFNIFVDEAIEAMRPLRVSLESSKGKKMLLSLPMDIPRVSRQIAGMWAGETESDRALAVKEKTAALMATCAKSGEAVACKIEGAKVSCEPVRPEKRNKLWDGAKGALRETFKVVRNCTMIAIALVTIASTSVQIKTALGPAESPPEILQQIASGFGRTTFEKTQYGKDMIKTLKTSLEDGEFEQMVSSDNLLQRIMSGLASLDKVEQANIVNMLWNTLDGKEDMSLYNREEYYASPSEMWKNRAGDCDDYAIAKYVTLRKLGFSQDDLHILVVDSFDMDSMHAVLSVNINGKMMILDNLSNKMLTMEEASQKYDLQASVNEIAASRYAPQIGHATAVPR